ncbi:zinc finger DNA-binding protein [Grosmannia clavigera kw1407]|uniref:Zinc finger DNA-binding protein n=1 Tax=Grosmannia clavigera (strain kw1407 / UAMH 11150) TaxID=655863 RepID=F0XHE8_GROCL|nr:zinc finger DNA-binding protein [Grosmannia clavigera kw1407]EFX02594.1 zinc finger DNA-binding protein [Grosmannia clavigera kw1407]
MQKTPRRQGRPRAARPPPRTPSPSAVAGPTTPTSTSTYMPATPSTASGRHTASAVVPSPGRGTHGHRLDDGRWLCDCTPPRDAVLRETRKPGLNKGRWFYTCAQTDRRRQCKFFLWEDSARSSGSSNNSSGTAAPASSFRTSVGRRTTPDAERRWPLPPTPATTPLVRQRRQPQPQRPQLLQKPSPRTTSRQRIFATPTSGRPTAAATAPIADDDSSDQESPPTPTPRPRRRDTPPRPASRPITHYFGSASTATVSGSATATDTPPPPPPARAPSPLQSPSYSDAGFDSDMERGCAALVDHIERENWRIEEEEGDGGVVKQEATEPNKANAHTKKHLTAEAAKMDVDSAAGSISSSRPNSIVVPTPASPLPLTPGRRRRGPGLLVTRDQRPASADTSFATSFPTSVATSFASSAAPDATAATATPATTATTATVGIKRAAADDGDQDEKDYRDDPFVSSSKKRRATTDTSPRDCPAAVAVLSLLADQPVDDHVRRRLRYMLNGFFAADNEPLDSAQ